MLKMYLFSLGYPAQYDLPKNIWGSSKSQRNLANNSHSCMAMQIQKFEQKIKSVCLLSWDVRVHMDGWDLMWIHPRIEILVFIDRDILK